MTGVQTCALPIFSVACGCLIEGNEEKCSSEELSIAKVDTGPKWSLISTTISPEMMKVDIYLQPPVYEHEFFGINQALNTLKRPVYPANRGVNY
mgnify:CR=1 FL=1